MPARARELPIGRLSKQTGVNIETIRYYEKVGLVPPPPRSEGGHRLYGEKHLRRLIFLRRCRELGFSLEEIRTLLNLVEGGNYTCKEVKALTLQHVQSVREKIRDLRNLERALTGIAEQCDGGPTQACPILETLFEKNH